MSFDRFFYDFNKNRIGNLRAETAVDAVTEGVVLTGGKRERLEAGFETEMEGTAGVAEAVPVKREVEVPPPPPVAPVPNVSPPPVPRPLLAAAAVVVVVAGIEPVRVRDGAVVVAAAAGFAADAAAGDWPNPIPLNSKFMKDHTNVHV